MFLTASNQNTQAPAPMDSGHQFELLLHHLAVGENKVCDLLSWVDDSAAVLFADGSLAVVVVHQPGQEEALRQRLQQQVARMPRGLSFIVVIGGDSSLKSLLKQVQPFWMINRRVGVALVDNSRQIWLGPYTPKHGLLSQQLFSFSQSSFDLSSREIRARLESAQQSQAGKNQELAAFAQKFSQGRPYATITLAVACGLMMLLEMLWVGSDYIPTLVRLGANVPARVSEGEWYRLASSMFLHGGFGHLLMNLIVLVSLGNFFERLLGVRRFLVLYGLSGLAGSVGSTLMSRGLLSVGASGALWGLLAASAVLAFRGKGWLPEISRGKLKRAALINLGLNLAVSFQPNVDFMAHLAGGLMGAGLMGTWLMGTQKRSSPMGQTAEEGPLRRLGPALGVSAVLIGGLVWAIVGGKVWELSSPLQMERQNLGASGLSMMLPACLSSPPRATAASQTNQELIFGNIDADPMMVGIKIIPAAKLEGEQLDKEFEEAKKVMSSNVPPNSRSAGEVSEKDVAGFRTIGVSATFPNGLVYHHFLQYREQAFVGIEVILWPQSAKNFNLVPLQLMESLQSSGTTRQEASVP